MVRELRTYFLIAILLISLILRYEPAYAWLHGWKYRRTIVIHSSKTGNLVNYPLQIKLSPDTIDLGKISKNGCDIRFTDSNDTELSYWIQEFDPAKGLVAWVKIPKLPQNRDMNIYLYFGNPSAECKSSPAQVGFFDDFRSAAVDTSKWTVVQGSLKTGNGLEWNSGIAQIISKEQFGNVCIITRIYAVKEGARNSFIAVLLSYSGEKYYDPRSKGILLQIAGKDSDPELLGKLNEYNKGTVARFHGLRNGWHNVVFCHGSGQITLEVDGQRFQGTSDTGDHGHISIVIGDGYTHAKVDYIMVLKYAPPQPTYTVINIPEITIEKPRTEIGTAYDCRSVNISVTTSEREGDAVEIAAALYNSRGAKIWSKESHKQIVWKGSLPPGKYYLEASAVGLSGAKVRKFAAFTVKAGESCEKSAEAERIFTRGVYAGAPRKENGRIDVDTLVEKVSEHNADTYNFLIWKGENDWNDLRELLSKTRDKNIKIWVTIVPPSEPPPSRPFEQNYIEWAKSIARLSLEYPHLEAWSIDDFTRNQGDFPEDYVKTMVEEAKKINKHIEFVPVTYYSQIDTEYFRKIVKYVDGVQFYYTHGANGENLRETDTLVEEVRRLRQILGSKRLIVGIYASKHSKLGTPSIDYVKDVALQTYFKTDANGIMIYTLQKSGEMLNGIRAIYSFIGTKIKDTKIATAKSTEEIERREGATHHKSSTATQPPKETGETNSAKIQENRTHDIADQLREENILPEDMPTPQKAISEGNARRKSEKYPLSDALRREAGIDMDGDMSKSAHTTIAMMSLIGILTAITIIVFLVFR